MQQWKNGCTVKVVLRNSLVTWKLAQYLSDVTGRPTVKSIKVLSLTPFVCHVHLHKYSWLSRISIIVANRQRKSTSLLKRSVSMTSISWPVKLANIAFQSVRCIYWIWLDLLNDATRPSGHISRPTQVNVSELLSFSKQITQVRSYCSRLGASWSWQITSYQIKESRF